MLLHSVLFPYIVDMKTHFQNDKILFFTECFGTLNSQFRPKLSISDMSDAQKTRITT